MNMSGIERKPIIGEDTNLEINKAMGYRLAASEQNIEVDVEVDTKIVEIAAKVVNDPVILEDLELFASMSSEAKAAEIVRLKVEEVRKGVEELRQLVK